MHAEHTPLRSKDNLPESVPITWFGGSVLRPPAWQQGPLTAGPLWLALLEMLILLTVFSMLCLPVVELIKSPR